VPTVRCNLAVVYAWTRQNDLAIAELDKLIDRPAGEGAVFQPTYGDLRLNFSGIHCETIRVSKPWFSGSPQPTLTKRRSHRRTVPA
jgi:hypothetical protein